MRITTIYIIIYYLLNVILCSIIDNGVQNLSGGELQRVAIVMALGTPADIYLIDEPSAYLDSEQRIAASKVCININHLMSHPGWCRLSRGSFFILRRPDLWWSTISSWPHISLIG
jgi:ABC-type phosphate/phosphonate transport system ATPase subunit